MSHMVIYRGSDGKPGYQQTDDIHDAVGFVEEMRNDSGVEQARIFRLEEVLFEYRPYYRVELAGALESGSKASAELSGGSSSKDESAKADSSSKTNKSDNSKEKVAAGDSKDSASASSTKGLFGR